MSEKPAFVRCPYCQHKLDKVPTRKTKCPDCGKPIYVRAGDLLREDELERPAGATSTRPRRPRSSADGGSTGKPKKKPKSSAQDRDREEKKPRKKRKKLQSDLRRKRRETYSRRDLDGGIQLLLGIVGKLLAGGNIMDVIGGLLGGIAGGIGGGDSRSAGERLAASGIGADQITAAADDIYDTLGEDEQRQLRAVVAWAQNGFDLGDRLTD
jgi:hypothetical protein